jgi:ankyrin repeat protein
MGDTLSIEEKQEKKILHSPNTGQASDLYWACRAGNVDAVRQSLTTTSFSDLNHLEPNGSTALHSASFFGHADVVRLLLKERGVMRHRKNLHGLTAYDETVNDEIRQLFHRPNTNRFCNNSTDNDKSIFDFTSDQPPEDDEDDDEEASNDWVEGHDNEVKIITCKSTIRVWKIVMSSTFLRSIYAHAIRDDEVSNKLDEKALIKTLHEFIDECIPSTHPEYDKVCELLSKYEETKNTDYLFRLYSLETPFYHQLQDDAAITLWSLLLLRQGNLKSRAFCGRTYRGLSMTRTDLKAYQKALRKKGSIIINNTFCSTSLKEDVARRFMRTPCDENLSVLMIFDFPQPCDMAIQLYALSDKLPCISDFEEELEVLVLEFAMFHVESITNGDSNSQYIIHLKNVLPTMEWRALWTAIRKETSEKN